MNTPLSTVSLKKLLFVLLLSVSLLGSVVLVSQNNIDTKNLKTNANPEPIDDSGGGGGGGSSGGGYTYTVPVNTEINQNLSIDFVPSDGVGNGCVIEYTIQYEESGSESDPRRVTVANQKITINLKHKYTKTGTHNGTIKYTVSCGGGPGPR